MRFHPPDFNFGEVFDSTPADYVTFQKYYLLSDRKTSSAAVKPSQNSRVPLESNPLDANWGLFERLFACAPMIALVGCATTEPQQSEPVDPAQKTQTGPGEPLPCTDLSARELEKKGNRITRSRRNRTGSNSIGLRGRLEPRLVYSEFTDRPTRRGPYRLSRPAQLSTHG